MNLSEDIDLGVEMALALQKIIQAFLDAKSGKMDPSVALAAMQSFDDTLAANRKLVDAEAAAKFGTP